MMPLRSAQPWVRPPDRLTKRCLGKRALQDCHLTHTASSGRAVVLMCR